MLDSKTYLRDVESTAEGVQGLEKLCGATVLVTGATGLIGSFLTDVLLTANREAGLNIHVLAAGRSPERIRARFPGKDVVPVRYDLLEPVGIGQAADYVIHAASPADPAAFGERPAEILAGCVTGTHALLRYAKRCGAKRFLFISSGEVYGRMPDDAVAFREEDVGYVDPMSPRSAYPNGKRAGETLCAAYSAEYGLDTVVARPCHTFGATMTERDSRAASQFLREAAAGRPVVLNSAGLQERSWCCATDCTSALLTILTEGKCAEAYNVADDASHATIAELAARIAAAAGVPLERRMTGPPAELPASPVPRQVLSGEKLKALGWRARFTLEEGIARTLSALREGRAD